MASPFAIAAALKERETTNCHPSSPSVPPFPVLLPIFSTRARGAEENRAPEFMRVREKSSATCPAYPLGGDLMLTGKCAQKVGSLPPAPLQPCRRSSQEAILPIVRNHRLDC